MSGNCLAFGRHSRNEVERRQIMRLAELLLLVLSSFLQLRKDSGVWKGGETCTKSSKK